MGESGDAPPVADAPVDTVVTDEVTAKLQGLDVTDEVITKIKDELGVATVADLSVLSEADLVSAGLKVVQARKLIGAFAPVATVVDPTSAFEVLPSVPDDASWLDALRVGGILKVDQSTVISAVRAALANKVNLYEVPDKLVKAMEAFADSNDEPVDGTYFKVRKQLTRRSYAEIFEAIDGLDGSYVTDGRKRELFSRIDNYLWPAITAYFNQLKNWQETWAQGAANPALLLSAFAGGSGFALPPGMLQAPDTGVLRDYGDAVNDAANKVFAGTGAQIASAVAYDALQIKKLLEDPRLPALVGAANREQMLKQLNVAVSSTYPRLERDLTRFVLGALQAKDQSSGNEELSYFGAMYLLGNQITWDQLSGNHSLSGVGGRTKL